MTNSFQLKPHVAVGDIAFNEPRESVRRRLNVPYDVFKRSQTSTNSSDHFVSLGVFVYYDQVDRVEAVEVTRPANLVVDGIDLLNVPCFKAIDLIRINDPFVVLEGDGFISIKLGLSGYMPGTPQSEDLPESLLAFRPGYYKSGTGG